MLSDGRFWVGVLVGVGGYIAYRKFAASRATGTSNG